MEQVAYIDLSKQEVSSKAIPEELLRLYLGGIGLNAYLLYNHTPTGIDPLDPANPLIFGAGLLNGYLNISASRFNVSGKSPETGIYGTGNAGGFWGPELKHAGFQHLVITGKASQPTYLWVHDGQIELRDASFVWGKDNYEAQRLIMEDLADPEVQIACIGQAGENLVRFACVMQGLKRAAGRTGMGCLMGSKLLKAVAVKGSQGLEVSNPSALLETAKGHYQRIITSKIFPILSRYGTLTIFAMQNESGQISAYNNQYNHFEEAEGKLEDEVFDEEYKTKSLACSSCPIHCSHRFRISSGPYEGVWGEGPEYYYMSGFGPVVGNSDWEVILTAGDLINRYGLDVGS
ncbi:MAG: aldehyde ferredoxin oxidoreductase N-terminal domain-containing protein, partial [Dehalococcoidia bacterium]